MAEGDERTGVGGARGVGSDALPEVLRRMAGAVLAEARFAFHTGAEPAAGWEVVRFRASEAMNDLYEAVVDLATEVPFVDGECLVGARAELTIARESHTRRISGVVRRVDDRGSAAGKRLFRVHLVPALWLLSQRVTSRIYQNMNVVAIVRDVLARAGLYAEGLSVELRRDYPPREYCVQYRESDLAFVMRLLEDEGIAFYFTHVDEDGETLVLADDPAAYGPAPTLDGHAVEIMGAGGATASHETVRRFDYGHEVRPTGVRLRDFDFTRPSAEADMTREYPRRMSSERVVYDYPGGYDLHAYAGGAYGAHDGARRAEVRYWELKSSERVGRGEGNVTGLAPGLTFELSGHRRPELDRRYLVLRTTSEGHAPEVLRTDDGATPERPERFRVEFECVPSDLPWRPPRRTPKPFVRGPQTATVVGPVGEEIHVDEHGRVRVQFHWDLEGRRDERSSCWMRVAQPWAGAGFGVVFTPRVGMEVVVDFLEGDPDRPIITGCAYNGQNAPPLGLPGEKTRSTIRTASSPGGGGFNEIRLEDASGCEEIFVHAQRDYNEVIERNHSTVCRGDQSNNVTGHQTESIGGNQTMSVVGSRAASVSGSETLSVSGSQSESVGGSRSLSVSGSDTVSVAGHQSISVGASADLSVSGVYSVNATALYNLGVSGTSLIASPASISASTSASLTLTVGGSSIKLEPSKITLTTGGATVTLDGANVTIKATNVTVVGSAETAIEGSVVKAIGCGVDVSGVAIKVKGENVDVNGQTTKVTGSASAIVLTGDAEITGGTVKLNS